MKLQAGNPNLMKINKSVGLGTFAQTAGDRGLSKVRRGYVPTERDPSLVPAPAMNLWEYPVYVSPKNEYVRPGADDHLKFKSVGNLT
jgi:hypothetical protein